MSSTHPRLSLACGCLALACASTALATNPLITDQFTADPSARVFEGRVWVYPSHDILANAERGRPGWFCMEDYHAFSSEDLNTWQDHGVIVRQTDVPWVDASKYSMWAPDCVSKDGRYYFYFPALAKSGGFRIGVAVAERPEGPYTPEAEPIEGVRGIDPCVFFARDGSAYLYYSMRQVFVAKLKPDMRGIDGEPRVIANLPTEGLIEGPFVFERNGVIYLTYPHVANKTERLEYAMGTDPMGPFKPAGVILDELPSGCWTVHQSMVEYRGEWLLFYHDQDLSPGFDKARAIRADRMAFEPDGTIRKVIPTLRGVGVVKATDRIEIDRYSATSSEGATVAFLDAGNPFGGWSVSLRGAATWVRFDDVDFATRVPRAVELRAKSAGGAVVEIRRGGADGVVLSRATIPAGTEWQTVRSLVQGATPGVHGVAVVLVSGDGVDLDWVRFD